MITLRSKDYTADDFAFMLQVLACLYEIKDVYPKCQAPYCSSCPARHACHELFYLREHVKVKLAGKNQDDNFGTDFRL